MLHIFLKRIATASSILLIFTFSNILAESNAIVYTIDGMVIKGNIEWITEDFILINTLYGQLKIPNASIEKMKISENITAHESSTLFKHYKGKFTIIPSFTDNPNNKFSPYYKPSVKETHPPKKLTKKKPFPKKFLSTFEASFYSDKDALKFLKEFDKETPNIDKVDLDLEKWLWNE